MAKKSKVKKTLVDQILDKAKIDHDSLSFNGLEGELPEDVAREFVKNTIFPFISISLPRKQVFLLSQLERLGVLSASTVKNLLISLMPSLLILRSNHETIFCTPR